MQKALDTFHTDTGMVERGQEFEDDDPILEGREQLFEKLGSPRGRGKGTRRRGKTPSPDAAGAGEVDLTKNEDDTGGEPDPATSPPADGVDGGAEGVPDPDAQPVDGDGQDRDVGDAEAEAAADGHVVPALGVASEATPETAHPPAPSPIPASAGDGDVVEAPAPGSDGS